MHQGHESTKTFLTSKQRKRDKNVQWTLKKTPIKVNKKKWRIDLSIFLLAKKEWKKDILKIEARKVFNRILQVRNNKITV